MLSNAMSETPPPSSTRTPLNTNNTRLPTLTPSSTWSRRTARFSPSPSAVTPPPSADKSTPTNKPEDSDTSARLCNSAKQQTPPYSREKLDLPVSLPASSHSPSWMRSIRAGSYRGSYKQSRRKRPSLAVQFEAMAADRRQKSNRRLNKSDLDIRRSVNGRDTVNLEASETNLKLLDEGRPDELTDANKNLFPEKNSEFLSRNVSLLNLARFESISGSGGDLRGVESMDSGLQSSQVYFTPDPRFKPKNRNYRNEKLIHGIKQFNLDAKVGINYLIDNGLVDRTAESVALFLFRQERLSKKKIGEYIGCHLDFNKDVLKSFVQLHQFEGLLLVQALRQFLWSFRLPGESMQIDRIMETFARHYKQQNDRGQDIFNGRPPKTPDAVDEPLEIDTDTWYILAFSIIMLNTALHNPNVKKKITMEEFVKQNKEINSKARIDTKMLEHTYQSIKEEPFKIPDETYDDLMYTFFSPEREGWLLKQGGSWKSWKRRWFVLNDKCLYYFQHTAENVPKGIIPLENVKVREIEPKDGKLYCFEVYNETLPLVKGCKIDTRGTVVKGNHKVYRMSASNATDRDEWVHCLQKSIRNHPFHDIINNKKDLLRRKGIVSVGPDSISKKLAKNRAAASSTDSPMNLRVAADDSLTASPLLSV